MTRRRIAIVGAGLCGSVLAARLRAQFDVTVIEQGRRPHPLQGEVAGTEGGINSSINRASGLGGTTNYWHNALIELAPDELASAGIDPALFASYYVRAWSLFLPEKELAACNAIREANAATLAPGRAAHMVVPHRRANLWEEAQRWFSGDPVRVIYGHADRVEPGSPSHVVVSTEGDEIRVEADHVIVCGGGLATPVLLAQSLGLTDALCGGYHDHPMAYVAKVRLKASSNLRDVSCVDNASGSIRTGFVYESAALKSVFYLRPALNLKLGSITGEARYVLSDLRNDPFSLRKIFQLLTNIEALREGVMFKTGAGFRGDFYSLLMLGEQHGNSTRGVRMSPGRVPALNWHVTDHERAAHNNGLSQFLAEMAPQLVESNVIPAAQWEYRTAAHHSGTAHDFLEHEGAGPLAFFGVRGLPDTSICDASLLQRGGVANSGLTLVALSLQLADALEHHFT